MQILGTGTRRSRRINRRRLQETDVEGFSLIELMVVTFVLSVLAVSVVLSLRPTDKDSPQETLNRLTQTLDFTKDMAFFTRKNFALAFSTKGWLTLRFDDESEVWVEEEGTLSRTDWSEDLDISLYLEGREVVLREPDEDFQPDVLILSSGEMSPFELILEDTARRSVRAKMDSYGNVTVE